MAYLAETGRQFVGEYLTSDTIVLEPMDSATTFNVHEGLLRSVSPVLSAACSREWKEGSSRHYKFREEVTEQMLLCFLNWAYHGDYNSADGMNSVYPSLGLKAETLVQDDIFHSKVRKSSKKGKKKADPIVVLERRSISPLPEVTKDAPVEIEYAYETGGKAYEAGEKAYEAGGKANEAGGKAYETGGEAYERSLSDTSLPVVLTRPKDMVVHPLLLHAKLYAFAHMYMIEPLKATSRRKLIDQLQKIESLSDGSERAAVFDVLAYTFPRLPEEDLLLHWLARYASWRLEELRQMPTRFVDLLSDDDSHFANLLLKYVSKSTTYPFGLTDEQIMPRYPIPTDSARYDPWRG